MKYPTFTYPSLKAFSTLVFAGAMLAGTFAHAVTFVADDFESYTDGVIGGGWTYAETANITTEQYLNAEETIPAQSPKQLPGNVYGVVMDNRTGTNNKTLSHSVGSISSTDTLYIRFDMQMMSSAQNPQFTLRGNNTPGLNLFVLTNNNNTLTNRAPNGQGDGGGNTNSIVSGLSFSTGEANAWYRITLAIAAPGSAENGTYDILVESLNDESVNVSMTGLLMQNTLTSFDTISFTNNTVTEFAGVYGIDNVLVTTDANALNSVTVPELSSQSSIGGLIALGVALFYLRRKRR